MAVISILPNKDTTIYSYNSTLNSGVDELLELSVLTKSDVGVSRALVSFSDDDINDIYSNYLSGSTYDVFLKLYECNSRELPENYTVDIRVPSRTWEMGLGSYSYYPSTVTSANWDTYSASLYWSGSYFIASPTSSQRFTYYGTKDIDCSVKSIFTHHLSASNTGYLLMFSSAEESSSLNTQLRFFSRDTNTIYSPKLECKFVDYVYSPPISSSFLSTTRVRLSLKNNKDKLHIDSKVRINVYGGDLYPTRIFSTSSLYNVHKYLPSSSYYRLKDVKAGLVVLDYDEIYTKLSADDVCNYFHLYTHNLEPNRYYELQVKSEISGSSIYSDTHTFYLENK